MATTTTKRRLAVLRAEWRMWKHARHPHHDFNLICPMRCGEPTCEACTMTAYRADQLAEVTAEAAALKAEQG